MDNKNVEGNALNHGGRMNGLTMLSVVINGLVQRQEMVTVITYSYYISV